MGFKVCERWMPTQKRTTPQAVSPRRLFQVERKRIELSTSSLRTTRSTN